MHEFNFEETENIKERKPGKEYVVYYKINK